MAIRQEVLRLENWLKAALAAGFGGALGALANILSEPSKFANFTAQELHQVKYTAIGGAVIALIHYFMPSPVQPKSPGKDGQP